MRHLRQSFSSSSPLIQQPLRYIQVIQQVNCISNGATGIGPAICLYGNLALFQKISFEFRSFLLIIDAVYVVKDVCAAVELLNCHIQEYVLISLIVRNIKPLLC